MSRVLVVAACLLVVVDLLSFVMLSCFFGWWLPLTETLISAGIGLLVIGYYVCRWSRAVKERWTSEEWQPVGTFCLEKLLLVVAGVLLIFPGILGNALGLILLLPGVRRPVARLVRMCI